jgi:hypothetical protein
MVKIFLGAFSGAAEESFALETAYGVWFGHCGISKSSPMRTITGVPVGAAALRVLALRI